jgi:selenocysteine lyase/cysteine desulfurase
LLDIGLERIGAHALRLAGRVRDGLARLGLEVLTPELARERAAMIRCRVSDSAALQVALAARGVKVGGLGGCLTMATHAYNSEQDVETALAILAEVLA